MKRFYRKLKRIRKPLRRQQKIDYIDSKDRSEVEIDFSSGSDSDSDSDWSRDDETRTQDFQDELRYHGLDTHFVGQVCRKTISQMKSTLNRVTIFLLWLASKISFKPNSGSALYLIYVLILEHYVLLPGNRHLVYE
jgi:hypothetical protein